MPTIIFYKENFRKQRLEESNSPTLL